MSNFTKNRNDIDYDKPLWFKKTKHAIYYILSLIEALLLFRFLFKLLGANPDNGFVSFIYSMTGIFIAPFTGIFNSFVSKGLTSKSVLEPATIIGMIVYSVIAWGIVGLIRIKAEKE
ncbi:YggT family protein [Lutispora thermophila]|uniref:YGGT family protein n=1 Tax=Lutispora thermophila DSM 19022 TaxID=1122184 RepID=A0A1M6CBG9_9FIRM|nr:YggT family protein [Lutispora thermophila]SHI58134.1 YGGT family protein [Lutispora thermophila DSM 19022]